MQNYMYYFEVAAVANLLIILYDMLTKKQYYRDDAKLFIKATLSQIALSVVDVLSCFLLENTAKVPLFINMFVVLVYFFLQALTIYYITMFPQAYNCHKTVIKSRNYVGALTLFVANAGLALSSVYTKFYFYFDENKMYHQGDLAFLGYYFYFIMVLAIAIYALMPNHKYLWAERLSLLGAMAIIFVGVELQYAFRLSLIIGLSTSIALLLIYVTMENPNSYMDKIGGCGNAEAIKRRMESWNAIRDRYAFVTVRVDNLKNYEHFIGGDKSEEIIFDMAESLKLLIKSRRNVYRLDDDSFTIILEGGLPEIKALLKDMKSEKLKVIGDKDSMYYNLEFSVAACTYPDQVRKFHSFRTITEYLLNEIKGDANAKFKLANEDTLKMLERKEQVENALTRALKEDSVDLFFQPIYDTQCRQICSLEALSRLTDPELGNIPPFEFIKVAEESGRIVELTQKQLEKICRFIDNNLKGKNTGISHININLSPILLNRSEMVPWIIDKMQTYDVPVGMLNFEITESATADSPEILAIAIKQLMDAGAIFSLDDYGTGYSNILYMANFPFTAIKFDKELIWSYFQQDIFRTILNKEFELVQELKENIVAEGVETEEQLVTLAKQGIRYIQGYYFSSPLSEERILEYLKAPAPTKWFVPEA